MNDVNAPIRFDPNRFETAAAHYLAGRPAYSALLIRRVAGMAGLDETARVLDLGCGPGQLAVAFAFHAGAVLALDPEPEMLKIAAATTAIAPNVTLMQASSYDLTPAFGRFRLAVMGRSFHWMDRPATLQTLDGMIEPGGAVALFDDKHPDVPENAWFKEFRKLVESYSSDDTERVRRQNPGWLRHEAVLLASAFNRLERVSVIERRRISPENVVDRALSLSSSSRRRLGEKADTLAEEVRRLAATAATETDGAIDEIVETSALIARRAT